MQAQPGQYQPEKGQVKCRSCGDPDEAYGTTAPGKREQTSCLCAKNFFSHATGKAMDCTQRDDNVDCLDGAICNGFNQKTGQTL